MRQPCCLCGVCLSIGMCALLSTFETEEQFFAEVVTKVLPLEAVLI
jgi:hypothetical protein